MSKKLKNIHYEDRAFLLLKDKKKAASLSKNLKQILQVLDQYDTSMNCLNWFIDAYHKIKWRPWNIYGMQGAKVISKYY